MILDSLQYHERYNILHGGFARAFAYLKSTDFTALAPGKYEIDGENVFMIYMEYETKEVSSCKMESHRKYIDIQYLVDGTENIGVSILKNQQPTESYDDARDVAFYADPFQTLIKLAAGDFAIFYPHDLHQPCMKDGEIKTVRKAVFKIAV
ncbi:MAG TPA: YhcH/YjgK/YiaL family protein [Chryseosolibacter sp.]|nr:YhcH/YjgK/YiaL family protein [Chryseosolibacter sp.]